MIHNLIEKVENTAEKKEVKFKGLKAGRANDLDTVYNGKFVITSSRDTDFIFGVKDKTTHYLQEQSIIYLTDTMTQK